MYDANGGGGGVSYDPQGWDPVYSFFRWVRRNGLPVSWNVGDSLSRVGRWYDKWKVDLRREYEIQVDTEYETMAWGMCNTNPPGRMSREECYANLRVYEVFDPGWLKGWISPDAVHDRVEQSMNNMLLGSLGSLTPAAPCEGSTMMCDHSEFYYGRRGEGAESAGFVLNLMFGMSDAGSGLVNWLVPGGDPLPIYGPAHADYQWAYTGGKMLVEGAVIEAAIMATAAEVFRFSRLVSTSGTINKLDDVAGLADDITRRIPDMSLGDAQLGRKIGKHAQDFGMDPSDPAAREWIQQYVTSIRRNPTEIRRGPWNPKGGGGDDFWFFEQSGDVVVTDASGNFVTVLAGGETNGWFQSANPIH